jgi:hypothetical protein
MALAIATPELPPRKVGPTGSKRLHSPYRSGRQPDWLKFKNREAPAVSIRRKRNGASDRSRGVGNHRIALPDTRRSVLRASAAIVMSRRTGGGWIRAEQFELAAFVGPKSELYVEDNVSDIFCSTAGQESARPRCEGQL